MPKLVVLIGERVEYDVTTQPVTIGRLSTNDIQILDKSLSKQHARIAPSESGWRISDLNSSNGTFVNGERVSECELAQGARIRCGNVELMFGAVAEAPRLAVREESQEILTSISLPHGALAPLDLGEALENFATVQPAANALGTPPCEPAAEHKLRLIQLIGEKTIKTFDSRQLVAEILAIAIEHTRAAQGAVCLFEDDGSYTPLATQGYCRGDVPRMSRTVLRRLLEERSGVLIRQESSDADAALISLQNMSVDSHLCVPLWTTDKIMGFISLDRRGGRSFTEAHLDLMIAIGHQAAIGIERGRLAKLAGEEQKVRSYLSQYLDEKLIQEIANQSRAGEAVEGDPLSPAEREVTVLFSDIVSFTKISEGLPPTELSGFIRDYLTAMTDIIFSHGGTIDKYIGDAVMALFGAPVASPNAAAEAIRAALEMRDYVSEMKPPGIKDPLRVRFGISTGKAVVGNIGSIQRVEYTALGDTVNIAARLEAFARPKEICIDEDTFQKVESDAFAIQEIGAIDVKNRHLPVKVYKVLG
ncbi:MAG: FHA domain-containing protein [Planctomycetales bacterium]|nr:FHA domain-containing protein [Planctomycetales bacterium]